MNKKIAVIIAPNWRNYAKKYLADCVASLREQDFQGELKFFLADNESTSETFEYITKIIPEAELILNKENDGFAKGCNDPMREALMQGFEYLVFINMDTVAEKNLISELVKAIEADKKIGVAQARIMLHPEKDKINSLGNDTHFLGFGYCRNYREVYRDDMVRDLAPISYFSGAGMIVRADVLKEVGLFDEVFWMYNEDQDLGWRIWLAGYKCVLAKNAVVYHKYEFAKSIKQYYWMDRNRIIVMLKCYHLLTLFLIFPAFLVMEFGLILFSLKSGWWPEKKNVWKYFLDYDNWVYILRARREVQSTRKVKDSEIVGMFSGEISHQEIDDIKLKLVNPIFNLYWEICKFIIIW
ncbi:MAG: glycosyltransferase family 2 protein [Candidatus Magasanikbacteria bacterium]|nr:glycosyltransferase family 2 protein [Candidatus Magasanikbacteria bacterium]